MSNRCLRIFASWHCWHQQLTERLCVLFKEIAHLEYLLSILIHPHEFHFSGGTQVDAFKELLRKRYSVEELSDKKERKICALTCGLSLALHVFKPNQWFVRNILKLEI